MPYHILIPNTSIDGLLSMRQYNIVGLIDSKKLKILYSILYISLVISPKSLKLLLKRMCKLIKTA